MHSAEPQVSIIVPVRNAADTIERTINSICSQAYANIEIVVIDGASTDGTLEALKATGATIHRLVSGPDNGFYDALNKGIRLANGSIIGVLNSDDYWPCPDIVTRYVRTFEETSADLIYADVRFFSKRDPSRFIRTYSSRSFAPEKLIYGWMPPHPSVFARKAVYDSIGLYQTDYRIAADYEFLVRALLVHHVPSVRIDAITVHMQHGGMSTSGPRATYTLNKEIIRACRENGISTSWLHILPKFPAKLLEYLKR